MKFINVGLSMKLDSCWKRDLLIVVKVMVEG